MGTVKNCGGEAARCQHFGVGAGGCDVAEKGSMAFICTAGIALQVNWNVRHKWALVAVGTDESHERVVAHDGVGELIVCAAEVRRHVQA